MAAVQSRVGSAKPERGVKHAPSLSHAVAEQWLDGLDRAQVHDASLPHLHPRHAENFVEQATEDTLQGTVELRIGCADAREERANLEEAGRRSVAAGASRSEEKPQPQVCRMQS